MRPAWCSSRRPHWRSTPLATPGVRVKYVPRDDVTLLGAVFNGDPAGPGRGFPQDRDPSGTAFRLRDGVFAIAEIQYGTNQEEGATGLPGTYKFGAYYSTQNFADRHRCHRPQPARQL